MIARVASLVAALAVTLAMTAPALAQVKVESNPSIIFAPGFESDPTGAIHAARQRIAAGDLAGAVKQLEVYVVAHEQELAPKRFLADLYYRQGQFGKAEFIYREMLVAHPHDKETHNRLGVVYATEDRVDDAIAQFEAALPGTDSVADLVQMHQRKGDLPAYERQMQNLAAAQPNDSDIQNELAQVYYAIHDYSQAMLYFRRALDSEPQSLTAINGLGLTYLNARDFANAQLQFHACLGIDPRNYSCNDNLAATYLESGQYAKAKTILDFAYHLAPELPQALINYGYLADVRGDWKRAVAYYVRAIQVGPYQPEAYVNLGIDYEGNSLYALAQSALLKGVAAAPRDGRIRFLLGRAYAEQGRTDLALEQFAAAAKSYDPGIVRIAEQAEAGLTPAPTHSQ